MAEANLSLPKETDQSPDQSGESENYLAPTQDRFAAMRFLMPMALKYWPQLVIAAVALLLGSAIFISLGSAIRLVVDTGFSEQDLSGFTKYLGLGFIGVLVMAAAAYVRFYSISWVGERVVADLRKRVFTHILGLSPIFFEETRVGEILSRLTTDTTLIQTVVGSTISFALRNVVTMIGALIMLVIASPKLTALLLLVLPVVLLPILIFGRRVQALSKASQDRVADVGVFTDETISGIRVVQAFTHEEEAQSGFADAAEAAFDVSKKRIRMRAFLIAAVMVLSFGAICGLLWIGGRAVLTGSMSAGQLVEFLFYAVLVAGALAALSEVATELQRASGAAQRLVGLLQEKPALCVPQHPQKMTQPVTAAIAFDNVTFSYPAQPTIDHVKDLSFEISPGETVALVGPSGAGKTTLFQLVLRFYDINSGRIVFDGKDIALLEPKELRDHIAWVSQEPTIFSTSALDNIRFGAPNATDDQVFEAAKKAHAHDFIMRLPNGYETFLGEKGVRLSGGQRQRLSIARAILRDPKLLLLDEATSALDAESERLVQEALDGVMVGRTTFVIAHRLATIKKADKILVMDQGQLVEVGTHRSLSAKPDGLYAKLSKLQFINEER